MTASLRLIVLAACAVFSRVVPPRQTAAPRVRVRSVRGNAWHEQPEAELSKALARASAEWAALQAQADAEDSLGVRRESLQPSSRQWREERAAQLLASSALDRLRPYLIPAEHIDIPPLPGSEKALRALLGEDASLVANFLSGSERLSAAGQAFWQAELYLRSVHQEAGEDTVEDAARDAEQRVNAEPADFQAALRGSVLLARQNFISAARFGYFLSRGKQRFSLECGFQSNPGEAESEPLDFLAQLRRVSFERNQQSFRMNSECGHSGGLESYFSRLTPQEAVELARLATREAACALEFRATTLFGEERVLLEALDSKTGAIPQLQLSNEGRRHLSLEAAAFGAALFAAEAAAAGLYEVSYTAYGSRAESPLR